MSQPRRFRSGSVSTRFPISSRSWLIYPGQRLTFRRTAWQCTRNRLRPSVISLHHGHRLVPIIHGMHPITAYSQHLVANAILVSDAGDHMGTTLLLTLHNMVLDYEPSPWIINQARPKKLKLVFNLVSSQGP